MCQQRIPKAVAPRAGSTGGAGAQWSGPRSMRRIPCRRVRLSGFKRLMRLAPFVQDPNALRDGFRSVACAWRRSRAIR